MHFLSILIFGFLLLINLIAAGQIMKVTFKPITCYNETTGSISVIIDTAYREVFTIEVTDSSKKVIRQFYQNSQQPFEVNNLKPGKYEIKLQTKESNEKEVKYIELKNPKELKGNTITIESMTEGETVTYSLKADPSGGTPPYSYIWSDNANKQLSQVAENLKEGTYTCKIADSNGCGLTVAFFLYSPEIEKYKRSIKNK